MKMAPLLYGTYGTDWKSDTWNRRMHIGINGRDAMLYE